MIRTYYDRITNVFYWAYERITNVILFILILIFRVKTKKENPLYLGFKATRAFVLYDAKRGSFLNLHGDGYDLN